MSLAEPVKVKVIGASRVKRAIERAGPAGEDAMRGALYKLGSWIMRNSKLIVPVDTNRLRGTGFVTLPTGRRTFSLLVGYGTEYALTVHEGNFRHRPPTRNKYLQVPFEQAEPNARGWLAGWTWELLQAGMGIKDQPREFPTRPEDKGREWQQKQKKQQRKSKERG